MIPPEEISRVASGLSADERAMLGTWQGKSPLPPPVAMLNAKGLLHINALKDMAGQLLRWKAHLTTDGLAVRSHLEAQTKDQSNER